MPEAIGTPLCRTDEIGEGTSRGFTLEGAGGKLRIFAVRGGGELRVYVNRCPHVGTPLDWAPDEFLDRERRTIVCATHGARFRIDDGLCVAGPCQGDRLEPFPFAVRDGTLYALDEFAGDFD